MMSVFAATLLSLVMTSGAPDAEGASGPALGLETHSTWALRAIACMRLEGSKERAAIDLLRTLSSDADPRVRAFATMSRCLRGDPPTVDAVLADPDRRVLRAAMWAGLRPEPDQLVPIVIPMLRPADQELCLLGIELAACVDDPRLKHRAIDALGRVVMRLDRAGAGAATPRLEVLLNASGGHRPTDWQRYWQDSNPRTRSIACPVPRAEPAFAQGSDAAFAALASSLRRVVERPIDLAICLDASGSMFADLPRAQALGDRIGRALCDLVPGSRVAIVGYRDRRSDFITRAFAFDASLDEWRRSLWGFAASKGGTSPEAVYEGLLATYGLKWSPDRRGVVVLIGDGSPHSGTRSLCARAAAEARSRLGVTTFVVSALPEGAEREVEGFAEIAAAGGGQLRRLAASEDLPSIILGPEFGDAHRALMAAFRDRCDLLAR